MRPLAEAVSAALLLACLGSVRAMVELDRALLPGDAAWTLVSEVVSLPLAAVLLLLLFSSRVFRPDAVGVGAALAGLAGVTAVGAGLVPDDVPKLVVLVALPLVGRILARRWAPSRWAWLPLAAVPVLLAFPSRRDLPQPTDAGPDAPLVVLVTLDTFRADHLGLLDATWFDVQTPNLDRLAGESLFFTEGVAPVPLTLPSHAAMLTGALPEAAGVLRNGKHIPDEVDTVVETLAAQGWRTGAFLGSAVLQRHSGLDQGFHHYDDQLGPRSRVQASTLGRALVRADLVDGPEVQRPGDEVVRRALHWLERERSGPTFLWVHLYDAHSPYAPPPPYDSLYDPQQPGVPGDPAHVDQLQREARDLNALLIVPVPQDLRPSLAAYAGEITWTDHVLGQLLAGLPDDARLVVAADHGESLVEHGYMLNHGWLVNQPSVRVPIFLKAPGVQPHRIDDPTPLSAIAPTLLQLAGIAADGSLIDRAAQPPVDETIRMFGTTQQSRRILTMHQQWRVGWRHGPVKWVVGERGEVDRFDLSVDPDELVDTAQDQPDLDLWKVRGREEIQQLKQMNKASRHADDQNEALRALGYVDG